MINKLLLLLTLSGLALVLIASCAMLPESQQMPSDNPPYGINNHEYKPYSGYLRLYIDGSFCSGIVIDDNYAMTASHCVIDAWHQLTQNRVGVLEETGTAPMTWARAVAFDNLRDVALLKGDFRQYKRLPVDFSGVRIHKDMEVISCGFPSAQQQMYCVPNKIVGNYFFRYRAAGLPLFQGVSGGPVMDTDGYVIGVNSGVNDINNIFAPTVGVKEIWGLQ